MRGRGFTAPGRAVQRIQALVKDEKQPACAITPLKELLLSEQSASPRLLHRRGPGSHAVHTTDLFAGESREGAQNRHAPRSQPRMNAAGTPRRGTTIPACSVPRRAAAQQPASAPWLADLGQRLALYAGWGKGRFVSERSGASPLCRVRPPEFFHAHVHALTTLSRRPPRSPPWPPAAGCARTSLAATCPGLRVKQSGATSRRCSGSGPAPRGPRVHRRPLPSPPPDARGARCCGYEPGDSRRRGNCRAQRRFLMTHCNVRAAQLILLRQGHPMELRIHMTLLHQWVTIGWKNEEQILIGQNPVVSMNSTVQVQREALMRAGEAVFRPGDRRRLKPSLAQAVTKDVMSSPSHASCVWRTWVICGVALHGAAVPRDAFEKTKHRSQGSRIAEHYTPAQLR
ncbi:hypothetical protein SKAU_G00317230 [Synaphobranchus kaupii]|uniref:Uncharacterized protein n=1 Tax=Synaphobranchus kaupii TaxID=118154 RepID=A0A9Q1IJR0_SYNKA|nr:hypothetical protein SKAU_G00317230 [Synaphobranchus kaupii]